VAQGAEEKVSGRRRRRGSDEPFLFGRRTMHAWGRGKKLSRKKEHVDRRVGLQRTRKARKE